MCTESNPEYILTYFSVRGKAEFIRLILEYIKVPYKMEIVLINEWPEIKSLFILT